MIIPKNLKVGNHNFQVNRTKTRDQTKGDNNLGKTSFIDLKIWLDGEVPQTLQEETFIHELLHVCFNQAGYRMDIKEEEDYVNRLSIVLYQILKDNKLVK